MVACMREYSDDIKARLELMGELQSAARDITIPLFQNGARVSNKADTGYDPVTEADEYAEARLRDIIRSRFPDDAIIGEEFDDQPGTSDWEWTLDPIDGTRAFVAGVPVWTTLIAVSFLKKPILGLIDAAALNVAFWGEPGFAYRVDENGKSEITTAPCSGLNQAILGCTEPMAIFNQGEFAAYKIIRSATKFARLGLDAFGYGLVAQGKMDIIVESGLKPVDVRALIPVIEGAGGKITNWHGGGCEDGGQVVAVGDPALLPELYTYLGRAMKPV